MFARPWPVVLIITAALSGVLSACGGGNDGAQSLPPVAATESSRPPSEAANSSGPTSENLVAAVRAYYAEIERSAATGDVSKLSELMAPSCPCRRVADFIRATYDKGSLIGWDYQLRQISEPSVDGQSGSVIVTYDLPKIKAIDRRGNVVATDGPKNDKTVSVSAIWVRESWHISLISELKRP